MHRDELAALRAQTHSHQHSSMLPSSPSQALARSRQPSRNPASPLSPRQIFQSRVRTLSDDGITLDEPLLSPTRHGRQLQHLSSLRVHVHNTAASSPHLAAGNRARYHSKDGRFDFSSAGPDFVAEERAAWAKEFEEQGGRRCSESQPTHQDHMSTWKLRPDKDQSHQLPLKSFGPTGSPMDIDERPKTSRGPKESTPPLSCAVPQADEGIQSSQTALRKSKFMEGSMNERSVAVASTWDEFGVRPSESSERSHDCKSGATPRPNRASRDSASSLDLSEFRPAATTPSTIKGKLTKLAKRASEDQPKPTESVPQRKKKGLRKSISTWNFHSLGDKMKFFGSSSSDLPTQQQVTTKPDQSTGVAELNDRKRRAEAAYAQQFGMKKQKSNDGIPIQDSKAGTPRTPSQPRTLKKRPVSPRTVTRATANRRRREASDSQTGTTGSGTPTDATGDSDCERRKRPSRSELEKENQQLRATLRERQAQQTGFLHRSASKSSVHLPLEQDSQMSQAAGRSRPASKSSSPAKSIKESSLTISNGAHKQKQRQSRGVPPVPALPSRAVLASLGSNNGQNGPAHETVAMKRFSGNVLPRPVSMILEEKVESLDKQVENKNIWGSVLPLAATLASSRAPAQKESWQWPDDVF